MTMAETLTQQLLDAIGKGISLARDGGHFWGNQVFGAIWVFSATDPFQGIRVNDATITSPTYSGIMFQTDYSGGNALFPVTDTIFTNTTITGAHQSGDAYDAKSGFGIWANPLPEAGCTVTSAAVASDAAPQSSALRIHKCAGGSNILLAALMN
jgi:hypothetical protein